MSARPIITSQRVEVNLDQWDYGLRSLVRLLVGAPKGSDVAFSEFGVTVSWDRRRKFNA